MFLLVNDNLCFILGMLGYKGGHEIQKRLAVRVTKKTETEWMRMLPYPLILGQIIILFMTPSRFVT